MDQTPLILVEATTALFHVGADDEPDAEVWIGRKPEKLVLDGRHEEKILQYPGQHAGEVLHTDEEYSIELQNVWLQDRSTGTPRMPVLMRGQRYQFVVAWEDVEAGVWTRRVYGGVTVQPNRVDDFQQTLRLRAERMDEYTGTGASPGAVASVTGRVVYVDGWERTDLYDYDFATSTYVVRDAGLLDGRAEIDLSVPGACTIEIGGSVALVADADGVMVAEIVATGGTFLDESPRLEWYVGAARVASLSQTGVLAVASITEQVSAPALANDFAAMNPGWLFSLAGARAYAPEFAETL